MFKPVSSPYLVPDDGSFRCARAGTRPPRNAPSGDECGQRAAELVRKLEELQSILYAGKRHALLLVFQAMDAAGKDSTIRAVMSGVNPAGCEVFSFKQPTPEELEHDFLWRTACRLPGKGRIGIFNRSYYEEVLVVRVHPEFLEAQQLPGRLKPKQLWRDRYESIRNHERHLARNGTVILKFWLNVSPEEQRRRFLSRLDNPHKYWKFSPADVTEREHWKAYMRAYEEALNATSRPGAPWYAIPADDKPYLHLVVAEIVVKTLKGLDLGYPEIGAREKVAFRTARRMLENEK